MPVQLAQQTVNQNVEVGKPSLCWREAAASAGGRRAR